jgi:hypothetical protein
MWFDLARPFSLNNGDSEKKDHGEMMMVIIIEIIEKYCE